MKIIEVLKNDKIIVQFQDKFKYEKEIHWNSFIAGTVKNPYDKSICNVGYLGEENEPHFINNKCIPSFGAWTNMIERCYNEKLRHKHLAYTDCTMCNEWFNYQTFRKWYDSNYYNIGEGVGRMHIDKDILVKDNRIYSPKTCIFVPQRINMIFMRKNRKIDMDLPNGIRRYNKEFMAEYNTKYLGRHSTLEVALYYYNIEKQIHINEVAEEYRDRIPSKLYYALINWNNKIAA